MGDDFKRWLVAPIDRMTKGALLSIAQEADPDHPRWQDWRGTKADLIAIIRRRRDEHWSQRHAGRAGVPLSPDRIVRVGERGYVVPASIISADEANTFLGSLPRVEPDA
ncbi:hypothetical protein [Paracoccus sp. SSK6]|uniref:hypothetical protein n=1 Tax=Paracoccus sp. SSK6 TaxID=3143131 RepID=UPI00321B6BE3